MLSEIDTEVIVDMREKRRRETIVFRTKDGLPPIINKTTGERKPYKIISARTCNLTFERLKWCLSWLKSQGRVVQEIDWSDVWIEEDPRETEFGYEHEAKVQETFRADYLDCLEFALVGGARKRQFVELRWDNIDFERGTITFMRLKKRGAKRKPKPYIIPMTDRMLELILRQINPETRKPFNAVHVWTFVAQRTYVNRRAKNVYYREGERYPITYEGLSTEWARWKRRHDVKNVRIHDIRHAAGTRLHDATGSLVAVRDGLGHANVATSERYAHGNVSALRAAMAARDALVAEVKAGRIHNQNHKVPREAP